MKIKISSEKSELSIVLAGDVCPGIEGEQVVATHGASGVLAAVTPFIASADLRLVQWETPVTTFPCPIVKCGPNLNSAESTIDIVTSSGFNIALLANNHTGDQGSAAVMETIGHLHQHGLQTVGAGENWAQARRPLVQEVSGRTIAILNFAENEFGGATTIHAGSAPQDAYADVVSVREAAAKYDVVIVALHGGHETNPFPSPRLVGKCRGLVEAGAKLVFNCHTHCPEGVEIYRGAPIIYSPGNFYFPYHYSGNLWFNGYLTKCTFGAAGATELEIYPYEFDTNQVRPLNAELTRQFEAHFAQLCAPLHNPEKLQQLFEAWSAVYGQEHYKLLLEAVPNPDWGNQLSDRAFRQKVMLQRNLFTCESHHDIIQTYLRLAEEQRIAEAKSKFAEIAELQKGF